MAHLALYREFRPQRFADVVGQEHITRTLRNALVQNRMHHAYLLSGPRGTGKTTVARILAKAVNCLAPQDGEPCNECAACRSITAGETMDVIEIDAASNRGIDEIRDLRDKVKYAPADLRYKVYIIDEVHMLSEAAFNALLKTLEEPPGHVLFILATTEKQKLPITILSRCQAFDYHRLSVQEIVGRLEQVCAESGVSVTQDALMAIARHAEGGLRDALSLLDQVMAYAADGEVTLEDTLRVLGAAPLDQFIALDDHVLAGDVGKALLWLDAMIREGKDIRQLVRDYLTHLRDLLLLTVDAGGSVLDLPPQALEPVRSRAGQMGQAGLLKAIRLLSQTEGELRLSPSPRLLVEVGLIRLAALFTGQEEERPAEAPTPLPRKPKAVPKTAAGAAASTPAPPEPTPAAAAEPAPSGAPAMPLPAGEGAQRLESMWDQVVELIRRKRPSTATLLSSARIGALRGSVLFLVAPTPTFAQLLRRKDDKMILEKALDHLGFTGLEVQVLGPDEAAAKLSDLSKGGAAETGTRAAEPSLLERVQRVFPKEIVHEVKEEGAQ